MIATSLRLHGERKRDGEMGGGGDGLGVVNSHRCWCVACRRVTQAQADDPAVTPLEKAAVIDKWAYDVREMLAGFFEPGPVEFEEVLAVARARHVLGSYEYGDTNLFEWSDGKVRAAILEELADAVVYQAWLLERTSK